MIARQKNHHYFHRQRPGRFTGKANAFIAGIVVIMMLAMPPTGNALTRPALLPPGQSGSWIFPGEPFNGLQIEYSVSGAELGPPTDEPGYTWYRRQDGRMTGKTLVVSGVAHAAIGWGATLTVRLTAGNAEPVEYTADKFPENGLYPDPMAESFSVSIDVPPTAETVEFSIDLTGDYNAGSRGVVVSGQLVNGIPWPCKEPKFFYPSMSLDGYFTGSPPLNFSEEQMAADIVGAFKRYALENISSETYKVKPGVNPTDIYMIPKAFISSALPTGNEQALQDAARRFAQAKRQTDPNYRLTPGDLFYLSLQVNRGNVRNALVTAHAALYRDGKGVNKKFIEQEGILTPLRNPDGYVDGDYTYKTPQDRDRHINPRRELAADEQGVWYHYFGLVALQFTDWADTAAYHSAWLALKEGGLPANYTDKVMEHGIPPTQLGKQLGSLAIALEDNVRDNMGKPPDIAKFCINYYALTSGMALLDALREYYDYSDLPNPIKNKFKNLEDKEVILQPTGVVIYKSPLSIYIQGDNDEWFSFDQQSGKVDGNTPLMYFELFPEDDGTVSFLGAPFFNVASVRLTGAGDGPVTLGLYDSAGQTTGIYQFDVHPGDEIVAEGLAATPLLNGVPLEAIAQEESLLPVGLESGNISSLAIALAGIGALVASLGVAVVLVVIIFRRNRQPAGYPAPVQYAAYRPATVCPYCRSPINPGVRFCERCGRPVAAPPPPSGQSGWGWLAAGIIFVILLCLLVMIIAGLFLFLSTGRGQAVLPTAPAVAPVANAPATAVPGLPAPTAATPSPIPTPDGGAAPTGETPPEPSATAFIVANTPDPIPTTDGGAVPPTSEAPPEPAAAEVIVDETAIMKEEMAIVVHPGYRKYENLRFDLSLNIPAEWQMLAEDKQGNGVVLGLPDNSYALTVWHDTPDDPRHTTLEESLPEGQTLIPIQPTTIGHFPARQTAVAANNSLYFLAEIILPNSHFILNLRTPADKPGMDIMFEAITASFRIPARCGATACPELLRPNEPTPAPIFLPTH